ncbi:hypothetical protein [Pedobacter punctiformis]|uniref:Alpha/beta hydrolase n=1 Tax=Pedobacter punctiformis TaxID=3004097 RepID=A0ABT4L766_9SPHI|nr:hypothetical protein [Pedobacter sp. HCMS5-2]MCZ4243771.1 hypothetical protein [Pedobacter sp. HCMS5-2]
MKLFLFILFVGFSIQLKAQVSFEQKFNSLKQLKLDSGVTLTFDEPPRLSKAKPLKVIIFALPNGNNTAQSFGKNTSASDDWHFNIQHIGAQTELIRKVDPATNYVVIYLENNLKSWPAWRRKYSNSNELINNVVRCIADQYQKYHPKLTLTGHSGGGSFIFGYLNANPKISDLIERIGFLDATYAYETDLHRDKLNNWLKSKQHYLQVIAYNDSTVVLNGKPIVSPTGGTWYRSKLMVKDLNEKFIFNQNDKKLSWKSDQTGFILIKNPDGKIFHTVLVERNGFIHLIFSGTKLEENNYKFWQERAYTKYILN